MFPSILPLSISPNPFVDDFELFDRDTIRFSSSARDEDLEKDSFAGGNIRVVVHTQLGALV